MILSMQRIPPHTLAAGFRVVEYATPGAPRQPYRVVITHSPERYCLRCRRLHSVRSVAPRTLHDVPYDGHPVLLVITEGRWHCPQTRRCHELRYDVDRVRCMPGLVAYLARERGRRTVRELAAETGLSASKVVRLQQRAWADSQPALPQRVAQLGLDDIYILGGQHLVAVDLTTQRVLALQRAGSVTEGRAGQIDVESFLEQLPETDIVALDLHPGQYAAARQRWPEATLVIDKRHVLGIIDRELLAQAARVVLDWHADDDEGLTARRVIARFGPAAYPYLSLRTLVLRRRTSLITADHVTWSLLRREPGDEARLLWQMYQWRESLYDLYDRDNRDAGKLQAWLDALRAWHARRSPDGAGNYQQPLGRIRWALETYLDACEAAIHTGVTNAATERANASIRRVLRQGHRYSPAALLELVNRHEPPHSPLIATTTRVDPPGRLTSPAASRATRPAPVAAPVVRPEARPEPPPVAPAAVPLPRTSPRLPPRVAARHRRSPHPELQLPGPVWLWLHSSTQPGARGAPRWVARITELAPASLTRDWAILGAGGVADAHGVAVPAQTRLWWRTTVLHTYARDQIGEFAASVRESLHQDMDVQALCAAGGPLLLAFYDALARLSAGRFVPPSPAEMEVLQVVSAATRIAAIGPAGYDTRNLIAVLDAWCSAALAVDTGGFWDRVREVRPRLPSLTPAQVAEILSSPALRWAVATELAAQEISPPAELAPDRVQRAAWFGELWKLLRLIKIE